MKELGLYDLWFSRKYSLKKFQYIRGDNSYKKSSDPFGPNVTKLYLGTTNIFLITLDQPSLTVSEI